MFRPILIAKWGRKNVHRRRHRNFPIILMRDRMMNASPKYETILIDSSSDVLYSLFCPLAFYHFPARFLFLPLSLSFVQHERNEMFWQTQLRRHDSMSMMEKFTTNFFPRGRYYWRKKRGEKNLHRNKHLLVFVGLAFAIDFANLPSFMFRLENCP